jgi:hypothetical protein
MAYKISALKVYIWPEVKKNNTPDRVTELQDMFLTGALDTKLVHACKLMDPEFKPAQIPWANRPNSEVSYDVTAAMQQGIVSDGLQEQSLKANLELFIFELGREALNHSKFKDAALAIRHFLMTI